MSAPEEANDWEAVETFADFVALLDLLARDWDSDEAKRLERERQGLWAGEGESWAQGTPGAWMEATHRWLEDMGPERLEALELAEPSWRTFAGILSMGRGYE